jgi:hypothetical protein
MGGNLHGRVAEKDLGVQGGLPFDQLKAYFDNPHWEIPNRVKSREALPQSELFDMVILPV